MTATEAYTDALVGAVLCIVETGKVHGLVRDLTAVLSSSDANRATVILALCSILTSNDNTEFDRDIVKALLDRLHEAAVRLCPPGAGPH